MDSSGLFSLNSINAALNESNKEELSGVDFSGKSLKLDTEKDVKPIVDAINACPNLHILTLTGNTLGVKAAEQIAEALKQHPEFKVAGFSDMFTGRMKTEIPPALSALGDGMIAAGARLSELDLSDNAFGPIGVEGLAALLQSDVCSQLQELRLNNNGLGITGGRLLANALSANPRRLKVFVAGRNRLENDGAKALANVFKSMGTLEEVAMPQNGIYHHGIKALAAAFKHNQNLRSLNLNDNTIGPKGAVHIAEALPQLMNLKSINFGDCLLKSKGAKALAEAFKKYSLLLECLDVSHNEIGKEACNDLVESITKSPRCRDTLSRVVLAGNNLGNASNKKSIRDKLGSCAELSDGEDESDNESEDPSDESEDQSDDQSIDASEDESGGSEVNESGNDSVITNGMSLGDKVDFGESINLDETGKEKVQSDVMKFLHEPTAESLDKLGNSAADVIDAHLQTIQDSASRVQFYVEAMLCSSALNSLVARQLCQLAIKRSDKQWTLAETMLRALALIKSEDKYYKIRWNLPASYSLLAQEFTAPHFPASLRDTLRFFIASKMSSMDEDIRRTIEKHPVLYKD